MATFTQLSEIDDTKPLGSSAASAIDTVIQNLKEALVERLALEHYSMAVGENSTEMTDADAQGRHIPGAVGCVGKGTEAERAAITSPGIGAIWESTEEIDGYDSGTIFRYTGSVGGWVNIQWAKGTAYASQAEVDTGTETSKALSPATLAGSELVTILKNKVQSVKTDTYEVVDINTWEDVPDMTVDITPTLATSKVRVTVMVSCGGGVTDGGFFRVLRESTVLTVGDTAGSRTSAAFQVCTPGSGNMNVGFYDFIDSPAVATEITYKLQISKTTVYSAYVNRAASDGDNEDSIRAISTITVEEIPV